MKLRTLKRRHDARTLHRWHFLADLRAEMMMDDWPDDWDDDGYDDGLGDITCEHCSGTGGDPWNDGITPCEHCDGEGYRWWS